MLTFQHFIVIYFMIFNNFSSFEKNSEIFNSILTEPSKKLVASSLCDQQMLLMYLKNIENISMLMKIKC